ncbi:MAG: hypothetical protein CM15mP49_01270 [Actinomycetota bacterium]|nr:MAG: hypothetical protein CM15mP49_01270 [Actinomycetota bacterium]
MLVLNVFGIAMILSAGSVVASQEGIGEFSYAMRQSIWFVLGLGALYCASKFDYRNLKLLARPLLYGTYFLMFCFTPFGCSRRRRNTLDCYFWHIISAIRNLKDRNCDSSAQVISDYQRTYEISVLM